MRTFPNIEIAENVASPSGPYCVIFTRGEMSDFTHNEFGDFLLRHKCEYDKMKLLKIKHIYFIF